MENSVKIETAENGNSERKENSKRIIRFFFTEYNEIFLNGHEFYLENCLNTCVHLREGSHIVGPC